METPADSDPGRRGGDLKVVRIHLIEMGFRGAKGFSRLFGIRYMLGHPNPQSVPYRI
jgi:hypothetical protein